VLDDVTDPVDLASKKAQLASFGQTPTQLFRRPHPVRNKLAPRPDLRILLHPGRIEGQSRVDYAMTCAYVVPDPHAFDVCYHVYQNGEIVVSKMRPRHECRSLAWDERTIAQRGQPSFLKQVLRHTFISRLRPTKQATIFMDEPEWKTQLLITGNHCDNSVKVHDSSSGEMLQSIVYHRNFVTCLAISEDNSYLLMGSRDSNASLWAVRGRRGGDRRWLLHEPLHTFFEHSKEVTCVAVHAGFDMAVSGSADGTIIMRTLLQGRYLRTITHAHSGDGPSDVLITNERGHLVSYSATSLNMYVHTMNGQLLAQTRANHAVSLAVIARAPVRNTELLLAAEGCEIVVRDLYEKLLHDVTRFAPIDFKGVPISTFALADSQLLVSLEDGRIYRVGIEGIVPQQQAGQDSRGHDLLVGDVG